MCQGYADSNCRLFGKTYQTDYYQMKSLWSIVVDKWQHITKLIASVHLQVSFYLQAITWGHCPRLIGQLADRQIYIYERILDVSISLDNEELVDVYIIDFLTQLSFYQFCAQLGYSAQCVAEFSQLAHSQLYAIVGRMHENLNSRPCMQRNFSHVVCNTPLRNAPVQLMPLSTHNAPLTSARARASWSWKP